LVNQTLAASFLMTLWSRLLCLQPSCAWSLAALYGIAMLNGLAWRWVWKLFYPMLYAYHGTPVGIFNRQGLQLPFWRSFSIRASEELQESRKGMLGPGVYLTTSAGKAREVGGWDVFVATVHPVPWLPKFWEPLPHCNFGLALCNPSPGGAFFFGRSAGSARPYTDVHGHWRQTGKSCVYFAHPDWERDELCVHGNLRLAEPCWGKCFCSDVNLSSISRVTCRMLERMHPCGVQFFGSPDLFSYRTLLFWLIAIAVFRLDEAGALADAAVRIQSFAADAVSLLPASWQLTLPPSSCRLDD